MTRKNGFFGLVKKYMLRAADGLVQAHMFKQRSKVEDYMVQGYWLNEVERSENLLSNRSVFLHFMWLVMERGSGLSVKAVWEKKWGCVARMRATPCKSDRVWKEFFYGLMLPFSTDANEVDEAFLVSDNDEPADQEAAFAHAQVLDKERGVSDVGDHHSSMFKFLQDSEKKRTKV